MTADKTSPPAEQQSLTRVAEDLGKALKLQATGHVEEAIAAFLDIVAIDPKNVVARYSLACSLSALGRHQEALDHINEAIQANTSFAQSYLARSLINSNLKRFAECIVDAQTAILIDPTTTGLLAHWLSIRKAFPDLPLPRKHVGELLDQTNRLAEAGQEVEAIKLYREGLIQCDPAFIHVILFNLSVIYNKLELLPTAESHLLTALALSPEFFEAHLNLGTILEKMDRCEDALARWNEALAIPAIHTPTNLDHKLKLLNNVGRLKERLRDYDGAEKALHESLMLNMDQSPVLHHWIHLRQKQCKWPVVDGLPTDMDAVLEHASPLAMLGMTDDPALQRQAARKFVEEKVGVFERMAPTSLRYGHDKIRIGYLSSDLSMHAVSLLTVELFETHDRSRFEIHAFCWSKEDGTAFRERVRKAFDHFHKIGHLDDPAAAQLILDTEIDVLVDLQGLTGNARPNIVARGPAPIQIAYLGYPGTTGLPHVDYVVADRYIFPEELRPHFSEKPLYVDTGFQVSDSKRAFGPRPTRTQFGLPENAFVFCAFNNSYKITEPMFGAWIRILKASPQSVLWLLEDNPWARENLCKIATEQGLDVNRLHFAGRIDPKDYLARFQVADLFLDTTPYNAGTTANDALWAGLPILTLSGRTYVSRMAGSLLTSAGLSYFICRSLDDYEAKAIALATNRTDVANASTLLAKRKADGWLFNTSNFCARFEGRINELLATPAQEPF